MKVARRRASQRIVEEFDWKTAHEGIQMKQRVAAPLNKWLRNSIETARRRATQKRQYGIEFLRRIDALFKGSNSIWRVDALVKEIMRNSIETARRQALRTIQHKRIQLKRRAIHIIKEFDWNGASAKDVARNSKETARRRVIQRSKDWRNSNEMARRCAFLKKE